MGVPEQTEPENADIQNLVALPPDGEICSGEKPLSFGLYAFWLPYTIRVALLIAALYYGVKATAIYYQPEEDS